MKNDGLHPTPREPLSRDELEHAKKVLTGRELLVYRLRREEEHAWNYIAERMDVSRQRVIHLYGNAEEKLGYARSVAKKQKGRYKPVAERREQKVARLRALAEAQANDLPAEHRDEWLRLLRSGDFDAIQAFAAERRRAPALGKRLAAQHPDYVDYDDPDHYTLDRGDREAEMDAFYKDMGFSDEECEGGVRFSIDDGKGYGVM